MRISIWLTLTALSLSAFSSVQAQTAEQIQQIQQQLSQRGADNSAAANTGNAGVSPVQLSASQQAPPPIKWMSRFESPGLTKNAYCDVVPGRAEHPGV